MIKRQHYLFASAVIFIGLCLLLALCMPRASSSTAAAVKEDQLKINRVASAFAGMPAQSDPLEPLPVRVIPISKSADATPTTVLTRIATALPTPVQEEPSHAVSIPETAVPAPSAEEAADPPRHRHRQYADICAAHGLHKIITHHGRSWRCR